MLVGVCPVGIVMANESVLCFLALERAAVRPSADQPPRPQRRYPQVSQVAQLTPLAAPIAHRHRVGRHIRQLLFLRRWGSVRRVTTSGGAARKARRLRTP